MKGLTWIIAGVGVAFAAYIVLNQPGPQYATGDDDVSMLLTEPPSGARNNAFPVPEDVSPAGSKRASAGQLGTIGWRVKGLPMSWPERSKTQPAK